MEYLNIKKTREYITNKFQTKKYRFYYYLSASLITILIFIIFAIYPTTTDILQELNTITIINGQNTQMQQRYNSIITTYSQYRKIIVPNKSVLSQSFPSNDNTGFIFANIYQILKNNNLHLSSISFSSSNLTNIIQYLPQVNGINNVNISVSVFGSYKSYLSFLSTISRYPQKILIYNTNYVPVTNNQNSSGIDIGSLLQEKGYISFNAIVFYY
jgi:Tfp pilus assembly protein PilO